VNTEGDVIRAAKNNVCLGTIEWWTKHDRGGDDLFLDRML